MDRHILSLILDNWDKPVVYVDVDHVIRYMNKPAQRHYKKWGDVVGKSIFDCHNEKSNGIIAKAFSELEKGAREVLVVDSKKHRVYMRSVRDGEGRFVGYVERYASPRKADSGIHTAGD